MESPFAETAADLNQLFVYVHNQFNGQTYGMQLGVLESFYHQQLQIAVQFGVRIGSAVVMALLLLLVASNYTSALFILYQINLFTMTLDSILQIVYLQSLGDSIALFITGYPLDGQSKALSVCSTLFNTLNILLIVATLILQIHTAFSDHPGKLRTAVDLLCCIAAFPCVLIHVWGCVLNGLYTYHPQLAKVNASGQTVQYQWVYDGSWPSFAATVAVFAAVLCIKLWVASRSRMKLGLEKFKPFKIIYTMASQNSVIAAAVLIATSATGVTTPAGAQLAASSLPITVVMMPIGYIWAQMAHRTQSSITSSAPIRAKNFRLGPTTDQVSPSHDHDLRPLSADSDSRFAHYLGTSDQSDHDRKGKGY